MRKWGLVLAMTMASNAHAAEYQRKPFGTMPDGSAIEAITLSGGGTSATIITLGASVQAVRVPDRDGHVADVALGYDDLQGYIETPNYFGATVGRYANRIGKGTYRLDGTTYHAPLNNGPNSLHGGTQGFDKRVWQVVSVSKGASASVTLRLVSADGDQGYPGTLTVTATYAVDDKGVLSEVIRATTDKPTIVNLSNHTYWNLAGEGSAGGATGHRLTIPAAEYTPVDATLIPTGEFRAVAGTPFDFRQPARVVDRLRDGRDEQLRFGRGYDHNWVVSRTAAAAPRLVARLEDPGSGRVLDLLSEQPGVQFYSGNFLDGTIVGKSGHIYRMGDAICLEPQRFPDTPNQPAFGSARLAPGETYENHMIFRFSTMK